MWEAEEARLFGLPLLLQISRVHGRQTLAVRLEGSIAEMNEFDVQRRRGVSKGTQVVDEGESTVVKKMR